MITVRIACSSECDCHSPDTFFLGLASPVDSEQVQFHESALVGCGTGG